MARARIAKTFAKLRAGALSTPTPVMKFIVAAGMGDTCRGCDELIGRHEKAYYVRVVGRVEVFGLHLVCAETWIRLKRQPAHEKVV